MTRSHTHEAESSTLFPSGRRIEVCVCGATREVPVKGAPLPWHTCSRCTHAFGLPGPVAQ